MLYMRTVYSFIPCCLIGVADNSDREEGFDRPPSSSSEDSEEDEDLDGSGDNLNNIISKLKTAGKGSFVNGQDRARKKKEFQQVLLANSFDTLPAWSNYLPI